MPGKVEQINWRGRAAGNTGQPYVAVGLVRNHDQSLGNEFVLETIEILAGKIAGVFGRPPKAKEPLPGCVLHIISALQYAAQQTEA